MIGDPLRRVLRGLRILLAAACLGLLAELLLLGHFEDKWQWIPLVLCGLAVVTLGLTLLSASRWARVGFRGIMLAMIVSGVLGGWFHYRVNVEFERELHPSVGGFQLFAAAMQGATPALAPGTMMLLGCLGWIVSKGNPCNFDSAPPSRPRS